MRELNNQVYEVAEIPPNSNQEATNTSLDISQVLTDKYFEEAKETKINLESKELADKILSDSVEEMYKPKEQTRSINIRKNQSSALPTKRVKKVGKKKVSTKGLKRKARKPKKRESKKSSQTQVFLIITLLIILAAIYKLDLLKL